MTRRLGYWKLIIKSDSTVGWHQLWPAVRLINELRHLKVRRRFLVRLSKCTDVSDFFRTNWSSECNSRFWRASKRTQLFWVGIVLSSPCNISTIPHLTATDVFLPYVIASTGLSGHVIYPKACDWNFSCFPSILLILLPFCAFPHSTRNYPRYRYSLPDTGVLKLLLTDFQLISAILWNEYTGWRGCGFRVSLDLWRLCDIFR